MTNEEADNLINSLLIMSNTLMTLISLTTNFGYPVVIGDILMTSSQIEQEVSIPVFVSGVNDKLKQSQKILPAALRQKIYIIHDYLVVALAGNEYEMNIFLEEIKNNFKYRELTIDNLNIFMKCFDYSVVTNCSALVLFAEKIQNRVLFTYFNFGKWNESTSGIYENVVACGSGSSYFVREALIPMHYNGDGDIDHLKKAISLNYILLARILLQERYNLETIKKHWGAGFEMIYYDGEKFVKMDDVTYVIWVGKLDLLTGEHKFNPFLVLNFKYYDDILAITATDFTKTEGYGVLPLYMKKEDVDQEKLPTRPHVDGKRVCSMYVIELSNGETVTPAFFTQKSDSVEDGSVTFEDADSEVFSGLLVNGKMSNPGVVTVKYDINGHLCLLVNKKVEDYLMETVRRNAVNNDGLI